jgi:hypothetical protein
MAALLPRVTTPTGVSSSPETDLEAQVIGTPSPPHPVSLASTQDLPADEPIAVEDRGPIEMQSQQTGGLGSSGTGLGGSQFNGRPTFPSQQQPVGTQKGIPLMSTEFLFAQDLQASSLLVCSTGYLMHVLNF